MLNISACSLAGPLADGIAWAGAIWAAILLWVLAVRRFARLRGGRMACSLLPVAIR